MSTGIEWTDETWNPVTGCTKVSPGCDNCYAERITNRFGGPGAFDKILLHEDRLDQPFHWRKPRRVFVNSMSDLFHKDVPARFIGRIFNVMGANPQHTFQVLTKRPGPMAALVKAYYAATDQEPFANVWLGTSVENQHWADVRIPKLLETPAAVRFLSCEPLLGPLWIRDALGGGEEGGCLSCSKIRDNVVDGACKSCRRHYIGKTFIDWAILGGESGPGSRPMHPDWARSLRDQCVASSVPFFFKQWGGTNKKRTGRELDGRLWDEFPYLASLPV